MALTRFKRTLKRARLSVRQLTHTLHLPPALSEIYGGPNALWLRDVLDYLPNLQSLIVSRLPFFDHQSLVALKQGRRLSAGNVRRSGQSSSGGHRPVAQYDGLGRQFPISSFQAPGSWSTTEEEDLPSYYELKLLIATKELNSTSAGLAEAIRHFPKLVYLDLSYTTPARDASVLYCLSGLDNLQVLKLRGIGLRDGEAEVLANSINTRARVLDIRDNALTDMAIRSLLQACFLPRENDATEIGTGLEDWPIGLPPGPDLLSLDVLRGEDLEQQLLRQLTRPLTGRLAFEDIPHRGLTHLYISGNRLSVEGLFSITKSAKLHVLDSGSVDTAKTLTRTRSKSSPDRHIDEISFPGAEKLIPLLSGKAGKKLTYLRVNHAVITSKVARRDVLSSTSSPTRPVAELPSTTTAALELAASSHQPVEMPAEQHIFELSAEPLEQRAELPGDIIHFALSPPVNDSPAIDKTSWTPPVIHRGSGTFAPEAVNNDAAVSSGEADGLLVMSLERKEEEEEDDVEDEEKVVLNATGTGFSMKRKNRPPNLGESAEFPPLRGTSTAPTTVAPISATRRAQIRELQEKRPHSFLSPAATSTNASVNVISSLHPSSMPHLQTLILTDVPSHVPASSPIPEALKAFISACADEAHLSRLLAQIDYSLPPGRSRAASELRQARSLFALDALILEVRDTSHTKLTERKAGTTWRHAGQRDLFSKSSTGDRDTEDFWAAAEGDFSFFGEEGEAEDECGIYSKDPGKYDFTSNGAEGMIAVADEEREGEDPLFTGMGAITSSRSGRPEPAEVHGAVPPTFGRGRHQIQTMPSSSDVTKKEEELVDVIAILSAFRRTKKAEFEAALTTCYDARSQDRPIISPRTPSTLSSSTTGPLHATHLADIPFVPGYWRGEVRVIRHSSSVPSKGSGLSVNESQRNKAPVLRGGISQPNLSSNALPMRLRSNSNGSGSGTPLPLSPMDARDSRSSALVARDRDEEGTTTVDYYGNRFEGGYLYP